MRSVRIGGGLGFYGDSYAPALDLVLSGNVQYVAFDHLAELTLAILQKDRARDPALGFAKDLIPLMRAILPQAKEHGVRLISNAGGLNPLAAARAVAAVCHERSLDVSIGVVIGDDVADELGEVCFDPAPGGRESLAAPAFASAYLGGLPVKRALAMGADVVVTGRVADSALFLGALAHGLDWILPGERPEEDMDWDLLAAGAVAGHLLECSGQVVGGNHSADWTKVPGLDRIGYPIAEVDAAGSLEISKVAGSGGWLNFDTVREQLLYEVHDPARYHTPDVTVDLTAVEIRPRDSERVQVEGVRGQAPPKTYKVVAGVKDGYLGQGLIGYSWPHAVEKARAAERILRQQAAARGLPLDDVAAEYLGLNSLHGPLAAPGDSDEMNEVYLRMAIRTRERAQAEAFGRLFPPLALSGPPTASGFIGIDPVRELFLGRIGSVPRALVDARVRAFVRPAAAFFAGTDGGRQMEGRGEDAL